jgi:hypothetical protein
MSGMKITVLTFPQIQQLTDKDHLYVINNSRKYIKPAGGDLNLEIKVGDNSTIIIIPNTWAPWDIGAQVPTKELINNIKFRNFVNTGLMAVADPKEAVELLKLEEVQAELSRTNERLGRIHRNMNFTEGQQLELETSEPVKSDVEIMLSQTSMEQTGEISIAAVEIVNHTELSNEERYAMLLNQQESLSPKDWDYIMKNITDSEKISNLAKKHGYKPE